MAYTKKYKSEVLKILQPPNQHIKSDSNGFSIV